MNALYFPAFDEFDLDECEQALCEYFLRLEFLARKLEQELADALAAESECAELEEALQAEFDAMVQASFQQMPVKESEPGTAGRVSLPIIYTPGAAAAEVQMEALRLQGESAAGALLLMLDEVIQRLRHSTKDPTTGQTPYPKHASEFALGSLGAADHVSTLIYAAGNAYRHAKDWNGLVDQSGAVDLNHHEYRKARRTIDLLRHSIDLVHVSQETACLASVERLTRGEGESARSAFAVLWDHLTSLGRAYAEAYAHDLESFNRVVASLEAQREYAHFRVSFSGNQHLWKAEELP